MPTPVRTLAPVTVSDLASETERWPTYCVEARALGVVAVAAIPIHNTSLAGSINLYDTKVRTWSDEDLTIAGVFADIAASYVTNAPKLDQERRINEQLQRALESRITIEGAKGTLPTTTASVSTRHSVVSASTPTTTTPRCATPPER